jgi:ATP phosphoribosyltransferase regulatory subunit
MTIESKNYAALGDMLDGLEPSLYTEAIRKLPRLFGGAEVFAEAERFCVGHPALSETLITRARCTARSRRSGSATA